MPQEEELESAISLVKAGKRNEAIPILKNILKVDQNNERGWLWLSFCVDEPKEKIFCFREVLRINPDNQHTRIALEQLEPNTTAKTHVSKDLPLDLPNIRKPIPTMIWVIVVVSVIILIVIFLISSLGETNNQAQINKDKLNQVVQTMMAKSQKKAPANSPIQTAIPNTQVVQPTLLYEPTKYSYSTSIPSKMWFSGGTLHKAIIREWRMATYANRLATSADYVVGYLDITNFSNMAKIKQQATDLEICISKAAEGGSADDEKVATVGAMCMVLLFP